MVVNILQNEKLKILGWTIPLIFVVQILVVLQAALKIHLAEKYDGVLALDLNGRDTPAHRCKWIEAIYRHNTGKWQW